MNSNTTIITPEALHYFKEIIINDSDKKEFLLYDGPILGLPRNNGNLKNVHNGKAKVSLSL